MGIQRQVVQLKDGRSCECITLKNSSGAYVEILTLGGIVKGIYVPDQEGTLENVVLEYKNFESYIDNPIYLNAIIGRTAGRVYKGSVTIDDVNYSLTANKGSHTLHGGANGLDKKIWKIVDIEEAALTVTMACKLEDMEEGYPGEVHIQVSYTFTEAQTLSITYEAQSSKDTVLNLTNHAYFNLSGNGKRSIEDHFLQIKADTIYELDGEGIPTGKCLEVMDHPVFDFNVEKVIGKDIDNTHKQLQLAGGYDHPWLLKEQTEAITLCDRQSGRKLTVSTNQEVVVVYAMNHGCSEQFTNDQSDIRRYGICFETQAVAIGYDEQFKEKSLLRKGEMYRQHTIFAFS